MNQLHVFAEQGKTFGIFSEDYEQCHALDKFIIMQLNPLKYIWRFEHREKKLSGNLLDFGWMLDERRNHFNANSRLFLAPSDGKLFGVKLERQTATLSLSKAKCKLAPNDNKIDPHNFSLNMLVSGYLRHRGEKIYILNPSKICQYFRNIL